MNGPRPTRARSRGSRWGVTTTIRGSSFRPLRERSTPRPHEPGDGRIVLVLDDVDRLRSAAARETIAAIATDLPDTITVALASRSELPLPVARLRAQGLVTELRHDDLAMTRAEAATLLRAAHLHVDGDDIGALMHRTEGWPVGLSLAALSLAGAARARDGAIARVLRARPACRRVPARRGARAAGLRRAVVRAAQLGPRHADHSRVRGDPRRSRAPRRRLPGCCARASRWSRSTARRSATAITACWRTSCRRSCAARIRSCGRPCTVAPAPGTPAKAIVTARCGTHSPRMRSRTAGELVLDGVPGTVAAGGVRNGRALAQPLHRAPDRRASAARPAGRRRAADAGPRGPRGAPAGERRAGARRPRRRRWCGGAARRARARRARGGWPPTRAARRRCWPRRTRARRCAPWSPASPSTCAAERERARRLEDGARRAAVSAPQVHALCLAQLALLALEDHDPEGAARLATRARSQVARYGLARYPTSALVLAVSALVRAQRGRVEDAREDAARGRGAARAPDRFRALVRGRGPARARTRRGATERRERDAPAAHRGAPARRAAPGCGRAAAPAA